MIYEHQKTIKFINTKQEQLDMAEEKDKKKTVFV